MNSDNLNKAKAVIEVIALLVRKVLSVIERLKEGTIDPDNIDLQILIDNLEALNDLPE